MANITIYKVEKYQEEYYRIFSGVYNDFKQKAKSDYNFELEPLDYDNFVKSIEKGFIHCLILFEDSIPTGFLVYTTMISESLELNIIHCIGTENINTKRKLLLEKFIEINKHLMGEKIITYPMLGKQSQFASEIAKYGFKCINTSVMVFKPSDVNSINTMKSIYLPELEHNYSISNWNETYTKHIIQIINTSFKDSSDALFDHRFNSLKGCEDIVNKIVKNIYGKFLPEITKVLLYKNKPVGIIFANMTNKQIANIPICTILKKHRNKGYAKIMLKQLIEDLLTSALSQNHELKELNVSCDTDNLPAYLLYESLGFTREYTYQQAYHSII